MHLLPEGQGLGAGAGHGGEDAGAFSQVFTCHMVLCQPPRVAAPFHHGGQIYKMARIGSPEVHSRGSSGCFCGLAWPGSACQRSSLQTGVSSLPPQGGPPGETRWGPSTSPPLFPNLVQWDGEEVPQAAPGRYEVTPGSLFMGRVTSLGLTGTQGSTQRQVWNFLWAGNPGCAIGPPRSAVG